MATSSKRDVQLGVSIKTAGEAELNRLASAVRALGQEGGDLAADAARTADALDALAQSAAQLDEIQRLAADFNRLTEAQRQAAAASEIAEKAYRDQAAEAARLRQAERGLVEDIRLAKEALADRQLELTKATAAARAAGLAGKDLAAATQEQTLRVAEQKQALAGLRTDRERATEAVRAQLPLERQLESAYTRAAASAEAASRAVAQQNQALQGAKAAATAAGLSVDDLAAAEAALADAAAPLVAQANALSEELQSTKAAAQEGAAAMQALERAAAAADRAAIEAARAFAVEEQAVREAAAAAERKAQADFDAAESADAWAVSSRETAAALAAENAAIRDSEQFIARYEQGLREAAAAAQKLADAEDAESMRRLEQAAREADAEMRQLAQSLRNTEEAAKGYAQATALAAGAGEQDVAASRDRVRAAEALIATERELTAAQRQLANERDRTRAGLIEEAQAYLASARAAEASLAATTRMVAGARSAGDALEKAFGQTGVRSLQAIEAEIKDVDLAVSLLERRVRSGAVSQEEFARASASAQVRLQTLKREMATIPQIDGVFERANSALNGLLTRFGALTAAVGTIGIAVRPVIEATVALEQMRRVLTTVSGSADVAGQQIEFLRITSQRAGQQFTEVGQAYAKFAASALQTGVGLETVQQVFEAVSLAAGNLGLSSEQSKRALEALSQIASKGVVNMEELRQQLGDALPGVLPLLAKELGLTGAELNKVVESGQLLANEAIPAIGRAMTALKPQSGVVNGLVADWNRFVNVLKQAGTEIVDGPIGTTAGVVLTAFAGALRDVLFVVTSASAGIQFLGNVVLSVGKVFTGEIKSAEAFGKAVDEAAQRAATKIKSFRDNAYDAAQASSEMAAAAAKGGESFAKLALEQQKNIDAAENQTRVAEKYAQAAETEAKAIEQNVALLADEREALDLTREARARVADARERAAQAADAEAQALREARQRAVDFTTAQEGSTKSITDWLDKQDEKIAKADADAAKTRELANAARSAADAADLAARKYGDQSKQLGELGDAVGKARGDYDRLRDLFVKGAATTGQVTEANKALRIAKNALRDAVDDLSDALERELGVLRSENAVKEASLKLELERLKNLEREALLRNDSYTAGQLAIRQREIELALQRTATDLTNAEIEAELRALDAQEKALQASGLLSAEKQIEIETRRRNLVAKTLETQATVEGTREEEAAIKALKNGTAGRFEHTKAVEGGTSSVTTNTGAVDGNTSSLKENAKAARDAAIATNEYGERLNQLAGSLSTVKGIEVGKGIQGGPATSNLGPSKIGKTGTSDFGIDYQVPVPAGYYYTLDPYDPNIERRAGTDPLGNPYPGYFAKQPTAPGTGGTTYDSPFGGYAGSSQQRSDQAAAPAKVVRVDINVNGKTVQVPTTESAAEQLLRELELAQGSGA